MNSNASASLLVCAILLAPLLATAQAVELKYTGTVTAASCCNMAVGDTVSVTYTIDFTNAIPSLSSGVVGSYGGYWTAAANGGPPVFSSKVTDVNGVILYSTAHPTSSFVFGATPPQGPNQWDGYEINFTDGANYISSSITIVSVGGGVFSPDGLPIVDGTSTTNGGFVYFSGGISTGLGFTLKPNPGDVIVVDPVPLLTEPSLLDASGTALGNSVAELSAAGRAVKGVTADGVTQVVLQIPASQVGETFTVGVDSTTCASSPDDCGLVFDPLNPPATLYGATSGPLITTATATQTPNGPSSFSGPVAFAAYRAPVNFVRSDAVATDSGAPGRSIRLIVTSSLTGAHPAISLTVVRPPVVLVHGLWSNSVDAWSAFFPLATGTDARFGVAYRVDYSSTMDQGVLASVPSVISQLTGYLDDFRRQQKVAAVQADIVAHSMGGLMTRAFTVYDTLNSSFAFAQGGVHKLISLDTPYLGSNFAARLARSTPSCHVLFDDIVKQPLKQDVLDLIPDSPLLRSLNTVLPEVPHIKTHAVVGSASGPQTSAAEACYYGNLPSSSPVFCAIFRHACPNLLPEPSGGFARILGAGSDLVVARESQSAARLGVQSAIPTSTPAASVVHSVDSVIFSLGPDVLGHDIYEGYVIDSANPEPDALIVNHVIDLLNARLTSGGLFAPITP